MFRQMAVGLSPRLLKHGTEMRFPMGRYSRLRRNVGFIGAAFLLGVSAQSAHAQIETTSSGPDSTSVTVYRDPSRGEGNYHSGLPDWFALLSEPSANPLARGGRMGRAAGGKR